MQGISVGVLGNQLSIDVVTLVNQGEATHREHVTAAYSKRTKLTKRERKLIKQHKPNNTAAEVVATQAFLMRNL